MVHESDRETFYYFLLYWHQTAGLREINSHTILQILADYSCGVDDVRSVLTVELSIEDHP